MLMYGTIAALSIVDVDKTSVFSITSLNESLPVLHLVPPQQLGYLSSYEFDVAYYNYIINNNDMIFAEFFVIIQNLCCGRDVLLVFSNDDWSENLAESLLKIIQQRYGYNGVFINSMEDYIQANNMEFNFNREWGLINLDQDINRADYFNETVRLKQGGKPHYEEEEGDISDWL